MSNAPEDFSHIGFAKSIFLPALLIFLIPVISLLFFMYIQGYYDGQARDAILRQIRDDASLTEQEKTNAKELFTKVPFSRLIMHPDYADLVNSQASFDYTTFRWGIRLSLFSIIGSIVVFVLSGLCVLASLRSQWVQYVSLSASWHVLRIFGAAQVLIQGVLLFALSYWVTAFFFEIYVPKLIFIVGILALVAIAGVIKSIFMKLNNETVVEGVVIDQNSSPALWQELSTICAKVGTEIPDQVIAGIDDNFFVTEQSLTVGEKKYHGRSLFVSLSLLKQLNGTEADAVLAHEMAHFSGKDTLYTQKINPLLVRYDNYLQGLYEGGLSMPIFYFMNCFRALYEVSLRRLSRSREFRADQIATEATSPTDMAGALLKIVAYSSYRAKVEQDIFEKEEVLESANVSQEIAEGFDEYASSFMSNPDISHLQTSHPFDSHPSLDERMKAVGCSLKSPESQAMLSEPGDGLWFEKIETAAELESQQWQEYEDRFRAYHEETLPYRFLPETEDELAIVVKAFPEVQLEGKEGLLTINHEGIQFPAWESPVQFRNLQECQLDDKQRLNFISADTTPNRLNLKKFEDQQKVLAAVERYYSRYLAAKAYKEHVSQTATTDAE
ncbi:M48 family metallopeptidase [Gimesia chilikensis]|uniref:M48 family metallopeptidase n=1 Tax=Gimesia chilikensis TaxID=2605989 RepID=UPI001187B385|nr:M48 family metallopeptidase [Gimesia chilikensis]QDT88295.1 heat shock protein HtpX [Gimesia chilikensis]